ncbi:AOC1 oxidase, partial [Donacobius atricapilla]|nr:AOC1 oxidase [Donacobius atricapilla]
MWLLALPWALALLVTAASSGPSAEPPDRASIFADLSPAELRAVRTFLMERPELGLSPSQGGPLAKNSLFLVELLPPKKRGALRFLEHGGPRPPREARAIVFFGAQAEPNVTELAVGPLPSPSSYRPLPFRGGRAVPFWARPMTRLEYELLHRALRFVEGFFLHPVGLEVLLDHGDPDPRRWAVRRLWYNGRLFGSYGGWSLAFRLRSSAGLQLFDVRFGGERVAYELSVQEAIAFYGGHSPAAMQTKYMDAGWAMGASSYELAPGVDCPETATFLDAHHLLDADGPVRFRRALCVFELPTGVPLRRHFDSDFQGGFHFYAGLEGRALVLRTTSTVYNYDYIWDFLLYPNGVLETKVHATGYIHATFYTPEGRRYGSRVHSHLLGNIHTHLVHYKVDLDVAGEGPWQLPTPPGSGEGAGREAGPTGAFQGLRDSPAPGLTPPLTFPRYHLAVTRRHENEPSSSSIYTQNDPWDPPVTFESFIRDNETIEDQDLVAWVTVGFLHVPHAEDIPNTATPGNAVGFFLRPFNFFSEDPSVASRAAVIVRPLDPPACSRLEIRRWTPASAGPCVHPEPFTYNGTYRQV